MPATFLGLPYPTPDDPISLGANDIRALAEAVDARLPFYGAAPPASPVDGREWILPVGGGVLWRFRYNAGTASAHKWEYLGGGRLTVISNEQKVRLGAALGDPDGGGSPGPTVAIPRAGDYTVWMSAQYAYRGVTTGSGGYAFLTPNATSDVAALHQQVIGYIPGVGRHGRIDNVIAGNGRMVYQGDGTNAIYVNFPSLSIEPVRVS